MLKENKIKFLYPALILIISFVIRLLPVMNLPYDRGVEGIGNSSIGLALSILQNKHFCDDYGLTEIREGVINNYRVEDIISTNQATSTARMPLYSLIIAGMLKIQGSLGMKMFQLIQILFDSVAAVLIYMILAMFVSRVLSFVGGLFYAVWLPFIQYSFTIHDGGFAMFINALFLYLIVKSLKNNQLSMRQVLYLGFLTAVSILMRSDAIWLALYMSIIVMLFLKISFRQKAKLLVVYYIFVALLISPWVIRNAFFYKKLVITTPFYPTALWEGLGDFPDLFKEYSQLNYDSAIEPLAREHGYQGPCKAWNDKETQIQLNAFLGRLFLKKIVFKEPLKYASFITIKWLRFFFAHRHFTASGMFLEIPMGPMRGLGVGVLIDLIILPLLLLAMLVLYFRSRIFWVIFLFPLISTFVHVFSAMNEIRYIVSSIVAYPIFIALFIAAVKFMCTGGKIKQVSELLEHDKKQT